MPAGDSEPRYQSKVDVAPILVEFLNNLRLSDIITELVQNDLDQGADLTRIHIDRDRLVAEGNGTPVNDEGWRRLTYIQGAGGEAASRGARVQAVNRQRRECRHRKVDRVVRQ